MPACTHPSVHCTLLVRMCVCVCVGPCSEHVHVCKRRWRDRCWLYYQRRLHVRQLFDRLRGELCGHGL